MTRDDKESIRRIVDACEDLVAACAQLKADHADMYGPTIEALHKSVQRLLTNYYLINPQAEVK